jgi:hypothetical protein
MRNWKLIFMGMQDSKQIFNYCRNYSRKFYSFSWKTEPWRNNKIPTSRSWTIFLFLIFFIRISHEYSFFWLIRRARISFLALQLLFNNHKKKIHLRSELLSRALHIFFSGIKKLLKIYQCIMQIFLAPQNKTLILPRIYSDMVYFSRFIYLCTLFDSV